MDDNGYADGYQGLASKTDDELRAIERAGRPKHTVRHDHLPAPLCSPSRNAITARPVRRTQAKRAAVQPVTVGDEADAYLRSLVKR